MTKEEIQAEVDKMKKIDCYFIGTTAYHQLGDLNRGEGGDGDNSMLLVRPIITTLECG